MLPELTKVKGVHPGAILRRELKIQRLSGTELADSIDEHKQTISAILNKRRDINSKLSIKLAQVFKVDLDYFMLLQASYDVKKASSKYSISPNLNNIRKVIFWDTTFDKIDWNKNRKSIIKRVFERGNEKEINEIISFYGKETVLVEIKSIKSRLDSFHQNCIKHNLI